MAVVQLSFEVAIGTRPGAHQTEVNSSGDHSGQQRRTVTFTVVLEPSVDIVEIADVVLDARVATRHVWLVEVDEIATPRSAARVEADLAPAGPKRRQERRRRYARCAASRCHPVRDEHAPRHLAGQDARSHQGSMSSGLQPQVGGVHALGRSISPSCKTDKM